MRIGCVTRKLATCRLFPLFVAVVIALTAPDATAQTASPTASVPQAADTTAKAPEFDVISIRQHNEAIHASNNGSIATGNRIKTPPDGLSASNINLRALVANAYDIKSDQISGGSGWIDSERFDIEAKVVAANGATPQPLTLEQRNLMLRSLLADRFKLAVHNETKELPIYELVVAKNGPKLPPAKRGVMFKMTMGDSGMNSVETAQLSALIGLLTIQLSRPVVDKTGLIGKFDIKLEWEHDTSPSSDSAANDASSPSIFTALQEQLGLKLVPAKGPVETIVIDHVERPSAN